MNEIAQAIRTFLVELVAFHRGEHRAKNLRPENIGEASERSLASHSSNSLLAVMLTDQPGQRFLQLVDLAFSISRPANSRHNLAEDGIQRDATSSSQGPGSQL